ncbi:glutathione peroxidase [Luteimonas viscosa]|uniref:Glutathione peroxidase n=1 Tax=Luteimonas viscosa TaxID=1132694 RepID=A0A5D4XM12_9GAMM|nr:glutathione peroxidase [Luteimonas viscosa]TYT23710.1 glutathione peroxidase [Luteimonas viscosa]
MKTMRYLAAAALLAVSAVAGASDLLERSYRPLTGKQPVDLASTYGGQVLLVVNTASKCGFAPQFEGLETLHSRYKARGFAVLGFPSADFRGQEFEDEKKIQEFCTLTYGVKFPMFQPVHVIGDEATPLYRDLAKATGEAPAWNFHKYLVGRDGKVLASWGSRTIPEDPEIVAAIERALEAPRPGT